MREFADGYYNITSEDEPEPLLARCYFNQDAKCRGFGFNVHDGGGFLPLCDLREDSTVVPVIITENNNG